MIDPLINLHNTWKTSGFFQDLRTAEDFFWHLKAGGAGGIRTHVRLSPKHAFQACAFNHSATAPSPQVLSLGP